MVSLSTIAIVMSSIIIVILSYVVFSKKGWSCTENGCVYITGGAFDSYNKCNSICKSNQSQVRSQGQGQGQNQGQGQGQGQNQGQNQGQGQGQCETNQSNSGQNCPYLSPQYQIPYSHGFYTDNYLYRRDKQKKKDSGGNRNHNENNIFVNSPTGPTM
jgi:hypothetical protein